MLKFWEKPLLSPMRQPRPLRKWCAELIFTTRFKYFLAWHDFSGSGGGCIARLERPFKMVLRL